MSAVHSDAAIFSSSINHGRRDGPKPYLLMPIMYFDCHSPNLSVSLVHASTVRSSRIRQYRMPDNKISIHLNRFPINRYLSCLVSSILWVLWIEPAHPSAASLLCATRGFSRSFLRTFYARLAWVEQFERCLQETYLQNG